MIKDVGPCEKCWFYKSLTKVTGECWRRIQVGDDNRPLQPVTPAAAGCAEHVERPPPSRLPASCAECRYWSPNATGHTTAMTHGNTVKWGRCLAFAPRRYGSPEDRKATTTAAPDVMDPFDGTRPGTAYAFSETSSLHKCGDGVSVHYEE